MDPNTIKKLKDLLNDDEKFNPDKIKNVGMATYNISVWVRAIVLTYDALLVVEPKRK